MSARRERRRQTSTSFYRRPRRSRRTCKRCPSPDATQPRLSTPCTRRLPRTGTTPCFRAACRRQRPASLRACRPRAQSTRARRTARARRRTCRAGQRRPTAARCTRATHTESRSARSARTLGQRRRRVIFTTEAPSGRSRVSSTGQIRPVGRAAPVYGWVHTLECCLCNSTPSPTRALAPTIIHPPTRTHPQVAPPSSRWVVAVARRRVPPPRRTTRQAAQRTRTCRRRAAHGTTQFPASRWRPARLSLLRHRRCCTLARTQRAAACTSSLRRVAPSPVRGPPLRSASGRQGRTHRRASACAVSRGAPSPAATRCT